VRLTTYIPSGDLTAERVLHIDTVASVFCFVEHSFSKTTHVVSSSYPLEIFSCFPFPRHTPLFLIINYCFCNYYDQSNMSFYLLGQTHVILRGSSTIAMHRSTPKKTKKKAKEEVAVTNIVR